MSSLKLFAPLWPTAAKKNGGTDAPNLLTPDPKEIELLPTGGVTTWYLDFGVAVTLDSLALIGLTPVNPLGTTPRVSFVGTITDIAGSGLTLMNIGGNDADFIPGSSGGWPARRRKIFKTWAPATSRYWAIAIGNNSGVAGGIGVMAMGLAIQPAWGHEWGSGRLPEDRSQVTPLRGGGFGIERGARMASWRFTCGDLTDDETQGLYLMAEEIGISAPVVAVEDPDYTSGLNDRIHYGLFDRLESYERQIPGATRWAFQVREWA